MTPKFTLPAGYAPRNVSFSLSPLPVGRGWEFRGVSNGYSVPALNPSGTRLCGGAVFRTKNEAALMSRILDLPPYQIWNGHKRKYEGDGGEFPAAPRA